MDQLHYSPCYDGDFSADEYRYSFLSGKEIRTPVTYALHWHEYFEIELCVSGSCTAIINGTAHKMVSGSLSMVSPCDFHEVSIPKDDSILLKKLSFIPEIMSDDLQELFLSLRFPIFLDLDKNELSALTVAFDRLHEVELLEQKSLLNAFKRRIFSEQILYTIISKSLRDEAMEQSRQSNNDVVMQSIQYMILNIAKPLSLDDIANRFFISPTYYGKLFKKRTGKSVMQYIISLRMSKAYYLVANTDYPISRIAAMVGYRSISLFYRHFSRAHSLSPNQLRQ